MSFFENVEKLPEDPILHLNIDFAADPRKNKVNLGVGTYKDEDGHGLVLSSVRKAESKLLEKKLNKDYLPIVGLKSFLDQSLKLVYGSNFKESDRIFAAQGIGGTGALRIGADFLFKLLNQNIHFPLPTWPNHKNVFSHAGLKIHSYPYYEPAHHRFNFLGMCDAIKKIAPGETILLHACCHNPTGIDPSFEQWKELSELIKKQKLFPFFDMAYQGFGDGLDEDAKAVRYFASQGHEMFVASSLSKNFGLYNERIGMLSLVTQNGETAARIGTQVKSLIRGNYSNPPAHGALIVSTILEDPTLTEEWKRELSAMRERVHKMRLKLVKGLQAKQDKIDFRFLEGQKGIFSYSGLTQEQAVRLRNEKGIFMTLDGRINVAGLNENNLNDVIDAIVTVL